MSGARAGVRPLRLSDVVARLERSGLLSPVLSEGGPRADIELRGVSADSRAIEAGDLFCAWRGTYADSHVYVAGAERRGAAAALVERVVDEARLPQVVVRDGRRAASIAAAALYGDPQDELLLAGVTGTNGKTTTVWILRHVLATKQPTASLGTLGVVLEGGEPLERTESLTTPGPVELARTLRLLVDRGVTAVVMEVSSHALVQGRVHALRFAAAVFTNLTHDHLDFHGSIEAYRDAKLSFVTLLDRDGWLVWNADDPAWQGMAERAPRGLSFGTNAEAEVRAENIEIDGFGSRFHLTTAAGATATSIPLPGAFNVQNALGAAAAAIAIGFSPEEASAALGTVPQVAGRLERIADAPCPVLRDYAHTPDALERVLRALRPLTRGRIILVFGAGGDRDRGKRPLMGAVAEAGADVAIVTSDNPRTEDPDAIIDEIVAGMTAGRHIRITDRRSAIGEALRRAAPEDIVLLAGKGHEAYQVIGTEKTDFDERAIVGELLAAGPGAQP